MRKLRDERFNLYSMAIFRRYFRSLCATLVVALLLLLVANAVAELYLRRHPDLLMSADERINEETRKARDAVMTPDNVMLWYDLKSPDDYKTLMAEIRRADQPRYAPYVQLRLSTFSGKFVHTAQAAYRLTRDPGPWPPRAENFNIFFFGNSTAFGVAPDWGTVASYLQDKINESGDLRRKAYVYNFGRSSYISSQEAVLFGRLLADGFRPDMALFLDGSADFCFHDGNPSSWTLLEKFYNDFHDHYIRDVRTHGAATRWEKLTDFASTLPIMSLIRAVKSRVSTPTPTYTGNRKPIVETPIDDAALERVIDRYIENARQIKAIAKAEEIVPVFVWQPNPTYKYDTTNDPFYPDRLYCHVNDKFGYPMAKRLLPNNPTLGSSFIWAADMQEDIEDALYVDTFHYTAPMSRRLAAFIYAEIHDRQLMSAIKAADKQ